MGQKPLHSQNITQRIGSLKSAFSNYNMVRMREALRYLSGPKLTLFIKIPFLIHMNLPKLPGYVAQVPQAHGIHNFKASGFYREGVNQNMVTQEDLARCTPKDPCVIGFYHIGSLGTFTQSSQSDFDYWVIIDKKQFTEQRYYNLEKKLDHIVKYARESVDQEVTFFIMDQDEIRRNCYAGFKTRETLTAPKLFLKEEFYRTFLMIAGKIPIWTILPPSHTKETYDALVKGISSMGTLKAIAHEFIDLGRIDPPQNLEILRGILWHICKSKDDPVKALIKASMIFSHGYGSPDQSGLLCDEIKSGYGKAGIDDYLVDPYKALFDRVIVFHETHAPKNLNLIKNAIFFRLCEYPNVRAPEPGSPKKQLLDRYIRDWNLNHSQVKKIISYPEWSEQEKRLLEKTFIHRLAQMLKQIRQATDLGGSNLNETEQRNFKILFHKTQERLTQPENKIQGSSTYLQRQSFQFILFQKKRINWTLAGYVLGGGREIKLHKSQSLLGLLGWITLNHLYNRTKTTIKIDIKQELFQSSNNPISADHVYLALQPVTPLSDDIFEEDPSWSKLIILLVSPDSGRDFIRAEFLALNTWGELFEDLLELDTDKDMVHRYKDIALKIDEYKGKVPRLYFYQLAGQRDTEAVFQIKQYLADRFMGKKPGAPPRNRPLLDKL